MISTQAMASIVMPLRRWGFIKPPASHFQEVLAVVLEFLDRLMDVGERLVLAVLGEAGRELRLPALHQLFQRAHVEVAVMEVRFEPRQMGHHEAAVLMHRVAAPRSYARRHP